MGDQSFIPAMVRVFAERRNLVIKRLATMEGIINQCPEGAFYVLPDVSSFYGKANGSNVINDCNDIAMYLLSEAHVATVGGSAFGAPDTIRFSYATSTDILDEGLTRIQEALDKLQ